MDPTGLILKINDATLAIDYGRKGFAIRGKADEGRISYEWGIFEALRLQNILRSPGIDPIEIELLNNVFPILQLLKSVMLKNKKKP